MCDDTMSWTVLETKENVTSQCCLGYPALPQ